MNKINETKSWKKIEKNLNFKLCEGFSAVSSGVGCADCNVKKKIAQVK